MRALCLPLKCCTGVAHHCDEMDKMAIEYRLLTKIKNIYNKFVELEAEK